MGNVNTQITLKNIRDIYNAEDGKIKEPEIRKATIDVMVDTVNHRLVGAHGDHTVYRAK
jgi:hypothetical protein